MLSEDVRLIKCDRCGMPRWKPNMVRVGCAVCASLDSHRQAVPLTSDQEA